jgi:hypothetical protein
MEAIVRWAVREAITYGLIALDVVLGFFTWLLITGLIPGDQVNFNVAGSLVLIVICTAPWFALDRYVQSRINPTT